MKTTQGSFHPFLSFSLLLSIMCFGSCGYFETEGPIPAFVHFANPTVETNENLEGAATEEIRDVWVFVDGTNVGIYEMPVDVPILTNGEARNMRIFAGIRNNGIQDNPVFYPFYEIPDMTKNYAQLERDTPNLVFTYKPNTVFAHLEDFEGVNSFIKEIDGDENSRLIITSEEARSGLKSGKLSVNTDTTTLEVATDFDLKDLPTDGSSVFLELDYKGNSELLVGLTGIVNNSRTQFYKVILKPQDEWQKIYVDFSEEIVKSQLDSYNVLLGVMKTDESAEDDVVYVDNIKLMHF